MKAPVMTLIAALTLALGAHAAQPAPKSATKSIPPVRYASVKVQVIKISKAQKPDGTYEFKTEKVCDVQGQAPVFAADNTDPSIDPSKTMTCETDLKVGRANINMTGMISLMTNVDLFGDGVKSDYKMFASSVWVQTKDGSYAKSIPFAYAASGNLNERTMVLTASGENLTSDKAGDLVLNEQLQVIYKFED